MNLFKVFKNIILKKIYLLKNFIEKSRFLLGRNFYLAKTFAPKNIVLAYLKMCKKTELRVSDENRKKGEDFKIVKSNLKITDDWFSGYVPYWLSIIEKYGLRDRKINVLEIGSWEGLSSFFIASALPKSTLTCVDTWEGGDEHKARDINMRKIEANFDENLKSFKSRLTKFKGKSSSFFEKNPIKSQFDLIYIDGSHHVDDVIIDAFKSFDILKVGGIIIFDDYFWQGYQNNIYNPAVAINLFLSAKKYSYKIVGIWNQIAIIKTSEELNKTIFE